METEELNEKVDKVDKPEDAPNIIKDYEEILSTKRKGIISVAYHQGKVFNRFREKEKFIKLVSSSIYKSGAQRTFFCHFFYFLVFCFFAKNEYL